MHSNRPLKLHPFPQWTSSDGGRPRDGCHVRGDGGAISLTAKETSRESARADGKNPGVVGVWQQPHVLERAFPDMSPGAVRLAVWILDKLGSGRGARRGARRAGAGLRRRLAAGWVPIH